MIMGFDFFLPSFVNNLVSLVDIWLYSKSSFTFESVQESAGCDLFSSVDDLLIN